MADTRCSRVGVTETSGSIATHRGACPPSHRLCDRLDAVSIRRPKRDLWHHSHTWPARPSPFYLCGQRRHDACARLPRPSRRGLFGTCVHLVGGSAPHDRTRQVGDAFQAGQRGAGVGDGGGEASTTGSGGDHQIDFSKFGVGRKRRCGRREPGRWSRGWQGRPGGCGSGETGSEAAVESDAGWRGVKRRAVGHQYSNGIAAERTAGCEPKKKLIRRDRA